jgi:PEP-CTERM motif
MRFGFRYLLLGVVTSVALVIGAHENARAVTLFADDFNAEPGGSQLNYSAFANWNVSNGTVDLIASGGFGISCVGGVGKCVDMDGSTFDAGRLDTKTTFNLAPGNYVLSFSASGNQRSASADDSMVFGFDGITDSVTIPDPTAPFATFTLPFTLLVATSGSIFFEHAGGDNIGIILDNVALESRAGVPEPSALLLLGIGMAAAGAIGICRRQS